LRANGSRKAAAETLPDRKSWMRPSHAGEELKHHRSRITATIKALVRTRVTAGLITILPIVITIWLLRVVFAWFRDASFWLVSALLFSSWGHRLLEVTGIDLGTLTRNGANPATLPSSGFDALPSGMRWGISIFSVLLTFFLLYVIGMFTANAIGRRLLDLFELVLDRVPFVKTIYRTLKQVLGLFGGDEKQKFQRVALVPFPNTLTRTVGFITNSFKDAITGEELCSVFIATTPNPTTGYVFILRRADIVEVDWTVEEAFKMAMSGGILSPTRVTMLTGTKADALGGSEFQPADLSDSRADE
jgi:uncharacterized membrane protein